MLFFSDGSWYCFGNININIVFKWNSAKCTSVTLQSPDQEKTGKTIKF